MKSMFLTLPIFLIQLSVGAVMVLFGIDQFTKPGGWLAYMPEFVKRMSPMSPERQMRMHALANIILGLLLAIGVWDYWIAWLCLLWFLSILPFAFRRDWRIGMRDLAITVSLVVLLLLLSA
jgi:uncharacterized protein YjeT (DUF2065 family)